MGSDRLQSTERVAEQAVRPLTGGRSADAAPQRRPAVGLGADQAAVLRALVGRAMTDGAIDPGPLGGADVAARALDGARDVDRGRADRVDLAGPDGEERGMVDPAGLCPVRVADEAGRAGVRVAPDLDVPGVGGRLLVAGQAVEVTKGIGGAVARVAVHCVRAALDGEEAQAVLIGRRLGQPKSVSAGRLRAAGEHGDREQEQ